ncbi:DNA mismatch repair endonuclease MutL [Psychrobacter jeotgali]|uniref:DNA mismatch repair endonuclease MutL n=1 Tax=Psychrobacter jeotgali TaxID=179010 RepID=UPI001917D315|nr:DNA mismatch repair endonuclease MutL [Psychrobacter jeotgali]
MPDKHSYTRIKKLSPLLINQLAAGEVVTRPAAVVKELLENAIDAGATDIEIRITEGGMGMIEVIDNGMGIHPDDMVMAITRHATSKVADVANLQGIRTLGFRGEALAATAAVSRLTLASSHDDSGVGRQLQVAGILAETPILTPVVHNRGTTVTVKDLYFNVPARRGNLKSMATEFNHIENIVREVALARADITLSLYHDNKKRLALFAQPSQSKNAPLESLNHSDNALSQLPLARLEQALGVVLTDHAIAITVDLSSLVQQSADAIDKQNLSNKASISGWLWPMCDQQQTLPKLLYINGRLVKEPIISNQLRQLAQSAQLNGVGYALYFELPYQWLNVNVHPSKQRIKISPLNNIMAHLSHAIQLKLKTLTLSNKPATEPAKRNLDSDAAVGSRYTFSDSQVQTPKRNYQYVAAEQYSTPSTNTPIDADNDLTAASHQNAQQYSYKDYSQDDDKDHTKDHPKNSADSLSSFANVRTTDLKAQASLPYCLDVISHLPVNTSLAEGYPLDSTPLPLLLFYDKGQLILISKKVWQAHLKQLFESHSLHENAAPTSAIEVNQQIASYATRMSAQDLVAFSSDIEALLLKQSIKVVDSHHLVTSMLSFASI